MNVIVNIDSQKFSFDGVPYFKNFMPHVLGTKLAIVNVYDSKLKLCDYENFANFSVDGVVHGSVEELTQALLPVLFTRASLGMIPGTTPTLPQVLAQGDRTIRYSDGDGDTILELADREKFLYNRDADFLHLPAELFPDTTELKIYNAGEIDLFGITGSEFETVIEVNGIVVDEFAGITLRAGTAVLKKISGEPYSAEIWTLSYEVAEFSKEAIGLGLVDNTPDNSKPVSTAQATAISNAQSAAQLYADAKKIKQPARFAVGTNVASLSGSITVDSNLVTSDTILLLAQTDAKQNGLWVVNSGGAWTRPADFATAMDVSYSLIHVLAGTYKGKSYATGNGVVVGTNNINLSEATSSGETVSWMSQSSTRFLDNTTALQKIFNVGSSGNGSMPVTAGRKYRVVGWAVFSGLTSTSKNVSFGVLGTATASYVSGLGFGLITPNNPSAPQIQSITTFSNNTLSSNSATTFGRLYFDFEFNCNGSGTFIPGVAFSAAVANMQVDSAYCEITDIGSSSATSTSNIV